MLGKLIKYDFKSTAKVMWTVLIGIVVVSILASAAFSVNMRISQDTIGGSAIFKQILSILSMLFSLFAIFAVSAASMAVIIILAYRFYKNFFDAEGYLTFTLPVSGHAKLISKILVSSAWLLLTTIVIALAFGIFILFGTATSGLVNESVMRTIRAFLENIRQLITWNAVLLIGEYILITLTSVLFNMLLAFLSITVGSIVSAKHKILSSVGVYFAINMGVGTLQSVLLVGSMFLFSRDVNIFSYNASFTDSSPFMHFTLLSQTALMAAFCVVSYFVMHRILERKLNLP